MLQLGENLPERFDLVVGADGIHSVTRKFLFGSDTLKYLGVALWQFWVPESFSHPLGGVSMVKGGRMVISAPIGDRAFVLLLAKNHSKEIELPEKRKEVLLNTFADFDPDFLSIIRAIDKPETIMRDNAAHIILDDWYKDRIILIGDAQHAVSSATGMGASMALEDAYVLAQELSKNIDISRTLQLFVNRRAPRIKKIKFLSHQLESWFLATGFKGFLRDVLLTIIPASMFTNEFVYFLSQEI
jgi:2-polyprenyl-6-methoxyphenol hydroxylase-like FAD-dependent oxidoreductase